MEVFVGSDYRGFACKERLMKFLVDQGFSVADEGDWEQNDESDYNDAAIRVALAVRENGARRGILICDSAHGMTMQANRFKGVRAANCSSEESAKLAREHDDANILCLSAHFLQPNEMEKVVLTFLNTDFLNLERRVRRINRLDERKDYD